MYFVIFSVKTCQIENQPEVGGKQGDEDDGGDQDRSRDTRHEQSVCKRPGVTLRSTLWTHVRLRSRRLPMSVGVSPVSTCDQSLQCPE